MGSEELGAALDAIERIGIINMALFLIVVAGVAERVWNARNNKDANKPLTDAIGALTSAVVSGDKRAEENTRAWQRVVEANTAALERAADSKDKIADQTTKVVIEAAKIGEQVTALSKQEGEHFATTSGKLDANAVGMKTTEAAILAAVESGTASLSTIERKLTEIQRDLGALGGLETKLGAATEQIGEVLAVVKALHADVDQRVTSELPVAIAEKVGEA